MRRCGCVGAHVLGVHMCACVCIRQSFACVGAACCLNLSAGDGDGILAAPWSCNARLVHSARADVSVHSGVSWACLPFCSTCVRAFLSAVWCACSRAPRCICAHVVFKRNKQLALLKIAPQATARLFLAVLQSCNARLFHSARADVSVHSGVSWARLPFCSTDECEFLSAVGAPAARLRAASAHIWFFSSRKFPLFKNDLKQRRGLSWQFCSRATQGFSAARAQMCQCIRP